MEIKNILFWKMIKNENILLIVRTNCLAQKNMFLIKAAYLMFKWTGTLSGNTTTKNNNFNPSSNPKSPAATSEYLVTPCMANTCLITPCKANTCLISHYIPRYPL